MTRLLAQVSLILALCFTTGDASADEADVLFSRASEAYRRGDFEAAADLFGRAHALAPSANKRFNEAQSRRRAGQPARAADCYRDALTLGLEGSNHDIAERKLADLEDDVGQVRILAPEGTEIEVAHLRGQAPLTRHLAAGHYHVTLTFPGRVRAQRRIVVEPGQITHLDVAVEPPPPTPVPSPALPPTSLGPQAITGITLMSLGGVGGIVASALGARFLGVLDDYEATDYVDTTLEDEALALRTATNVAFAAGAVLGAAGLIVFLTRPGEPTPAASIVLTPRGATLGARF